MKITCQACAAKYTIADEKVLGKVVKIRCKKCGATIIVNGNDPAAMSAGPAPHSYDYAHSAAQAAQGEPWTVNVADGDQRTMTEQEIAGAYHAGVVSDDTFCWRDGMNDWLPIREIEPLYAACTATSAMAPPSAAAPPPPPPAYTANHPSEPPDDGVTTIQPSGLAPMEPEPAPAYAAPRPAAGAPAFDANGDGMAASPPSAAARRAGGRTAGADLFSGAARAGGENDVTTSAPQGIPQAHDEAPKLTGQRNENSVLFSLSALTSRSARESEKPAAGEASGLIDIRQLASQMTPDNGRKKSSRVDDIMNLGGGGAFSPSLAAPVLSAPSIDEYAQPSGPDASATARAQSKSRVLFFGALGAGAFVVVAAIGAAVLLTRAPHVETRESADQAKASPSASAAEAPPATPAPVAASAPPAPAAPAPAAAAASTASATSPPPSSTSKTPTTSKTASATTSTAAPTSAPTPPPATTATATATPATTAAAAAASDQPFNMGEAKARLAAIAGSVQGCKKGDGPTGTGRVVVTFAPSGNVQSAAISGPPFEGTPTGACVAGRFRGAHVPAFSGSPFPVSKSFTIN